MADNKKESRDVTLNNSVSMLYADLLNRRRSEKAHKEEEKRMRKELKQQEKEEKKLEKENEPKISKKEKRQNELDAWKEIVIGLTGDDIEYSGKKKNKKRKYRKWIDDDDTGSSLTQKPKKIKKKNYNKVFEPELNMLRTLVAEQNKFTTDLQKRFANAAGPATKDAMPPNKAMVDLASVISSGRTNSLGMLREIGNIKKTVADLMMKQKKLDFDTGSMKNSGAGDTDLTLMGSNIASSIFGDINGPAMPVDNQPTQQPAMNIAMPNVQSANIYATPPAEQVQYTQPQQQTPMFNSFDPETWGADTVQDTSYAVAEATPHTIYLEKNKDTGDMRFVAVRDDNGEYLENCSDLPTSDPNRLKINEKDGTVKGEFDEVYKLKYV